MSRSRTLAVVRYCAEECERQLVGPLYVWWMYEAWEYATKRWSESAYDPMKAADLIRIGHLIDREANPPHSWRVVPVRVGDHLPPTPAEVPGRMDRYLELLAAMTPEEAYREFEEIHPFRDGNGRAGKVLYNWLKGTLHTGRPVMPPNFFGGANP